MSLRGESADRWRRVKAKLESFVHEEPNVRFVVLKWLSYVVVPVWPRKFSNYLLMRSNQARASHPARHIRRRVQRPLKNLSMNLLLMSRAFRNCLPVILL